MLMVPIAWPPSTSLLLQCCLFKSEEQTEIAVKTPAQSLCGPTGMRRSMLGLLAFSVCVLEGNDLKQSFRSLSSERSRSRNVQLQLSFLSLYFSPGVSFSSHFSPNPSFSLLLFVCLSLHPVVTSGPLFHPSLSPSSPPSLTEPLCNVDHQAWLCQLRHSSH